MAGKKFSGIVDTAMDDVYKDNLEYAAKVFKEKGFVGLIEPISEVVIPHYFMNSVSKGEFLNDMIGFYFIIDFLFS